MTGDRLFVRVPLEILSPSFFQFSFAARTRFHGAAQGVAEFLEIGPPVSLAGDGAAATLKAARSGIGGPANRSASGLNWAFRRMATGSVRGTLSKFGNVVSPVLRPIGAFTTGYNLSVAGQLYWE